ncbi:PTS mannose transporter subunit IIA [Tetragenococcus halophilus]|uniref:PTS sugar transporter subunit IIA n=1 Tax=Tetragenococcus halophilus TaxID=51669 RepID=UPI000CCC2F57|nr:PTS mannose transporter subunit IIA [Tetragenococcus halophilus]MCO8286854.1 PTS mannose transporter subunit IIA [Tetragenococcus halophilus]GFK21084.1 mannose/fructose-specific PTS system IIA component [Tetragenococcus halophilus]GMG60840.1 PTS mannose transporter subunit IIA [Tetragenococcus halophilus]
MDRKIILASHGKFASGILSSLELICGKNEAISALDCYINENFDLKKTIDQLMLENEKKELIVVTDLFGGSVNNEFLRYIKRPDFYLIAGLNLPFLIEFSTQFANTDKVSELILQSLDNCKESIQFCNESFDKEVEEEEF